MLEFKGDVNNDGKIDVVDVIYCLRLYSGLEGDTNAKKRADVDNDGSVTLTDLKKIYAHTNCEDLIDGVIYNG